MVTIKGLAHPIFIIPVDTEVLSIKDRYPDSLDLADCDQKIKSIKTRATKVK